MHAADALAVFSAFGANLRTLAAGMLVMRRIQQHEMCGRPADLRARHHQPEMRGPDMLTSDLQAMRHRRSETGLVAAQALVDAALHVFAHLHANLPFC